MPKHIAIFQGKEVRKTLHNGEWFFSVIDVVEVLTGSDRPRKYWSDLKVKLVKEGFDQLSEKIGQLKLPSADGKSYVTDCADTGTMFRLIQSIPSPKVEPFKQWLAQVGYERVQEIENPELASQRIRETYRKKGYSDEWIEKRMRGIVIRAELTDEWGDRGAEEARDYEILTSEISKAAFGVTPSEYKKIKGLKRENLRDHMDDFELIFTMLAERTTTEIHRLEDSKGLPKLKDDARAGGDIAAKSRKALEVRTKRSVVSKENYLKEAEAVKRARFKKKGT